MFGSSTMQAGKTVQDYELTVIYSPCNAQAQALASSVKFTVEDAETAGFEVYSMDIEGKKRLAYPINKYGKEEKYGIYAFFRLAGNGCVSELSDKLCGANTVLRHLLVRSRNSYQRKSKEYK